MLAKNSRILQLKVVISGFLHLSLCFYMENWVDFEVGKFWRLSLLKVKLVAKFLEFVKIFLLVCVSLRFRVSRLMFLALKFNKYVFTCGVLGILDSKEQISRNSQLNSFNPWHYVHFCWDFWVGNVYILFLGWS